jgi:Sortase domain
MTGVATTRPSNRSKGWWVASVVLLLVGTGSLAAGVQNHRHPLAGPVASHTAARAPRVTVTPLTVARSAPVSLSVPALGLTVPLITLGLNLDGSVQVPPSPQQAGWFRMGPTPGQLGSAVILGHVDSYQGPGVFFEIRTLTVGDRVDVGLADGVTAQFAVTSVVMYPQDQFPARQVYSSRGISALQLVTCGGVFDTQTRGYLSNVVVYTSLISATPPTALS